ncbi:MAG: DUF481 domain-containing protein [Cellvibrionaceae bacterium]
MKKTFLLGCVCALGATSVLAEGWSGKGELGFVNVAGNSESQTLNGAITVEKEAGQWKHIAKATALQSSTDGDTKGESYSLGWRSEYAFDERLYGFGDFRFFEDKFDSFDEIYTLAFGAGYRVIMEEDITWNLSAGIGYRDTTLNEVTEIRTPITNILISRTTTHEDISGVTLLLESDYKHKLSETTSFENYTRIEPTNDNTFVQNVTGLSVSINSALALKVGYDIRYNTDPAKDFKSTDRITSVNVVYSF